jgi:hypothetical protein
MRAILPHGDVLSAELGLPVRHALVPVCERLCESNQKLALVSAGRARLGSLSRGPLVQPRCSGIKEQ